MRAELQRGLQRRRRAGRRGERAGYCRRAEPQKRRELQERERRLVEARVGRGELRHGGRHATDAAQLAGELAQLGGPHTAQRRAHPVAPDARLESRLGLRLRLRRLLVVKQALSLYRRRDVAGFAETSSRWVSCAAWFSGCAHPFAGSCEFKSRC